MRGFNNEAWVTSVLNEDEVTSALVLCAALKNVCTNRWICAVVSMSKTSLKSRDALNQSFDLIFLLDEDRNRKDGGKLNLNFEDFAKLSVIQCMRSFGKCVYLEPGMMPLKNCDEIFQIKDCDQENGQEMMRRFIFLENLDTSIFVFKPSMELSLEIMKAFDGPTNGNNCLKSVLNKCTRKNENEDELYLDKSYNWKFSLDVDNVDNENWLDNEISLVNFGNSHIDLETGSKLVIENLPLPIKLAFNHWRNLHLEQKEILAGKIPKASDSSDWKKEPIAIVGMSCRYPGANNLEEFWKILVEGEDATGNPPSFRWLREDSPFFDPECRKSNAGFLKVPIDEFDSRFFGISPKEVQSMDPQHRLLHEVIWESLEDAAIDPHSLQGSSGSVFLGSWLNDYKDICVSTGKTEFYRGYMGNSIGAMAARISHFLGLTGPSIATESGCSSAMVALHLACKSLRQGETNLALTGGVNLLLRPFQKDFMPMVISPDGHCKTFDEGANGFGRAEGCGVLVLKRLSDAVKDGDRIWALIRGSGVSQEGTSKSMGTPTVHSESLAMEQALEDANVRPEDISYVEAHGTGTAVGDPLEVAAIAKVYHSKRRSQPLVIGSVKANVGHTESCSGITGIMKVVLSMVHEMIPPQRNLTRLNPAIDLESVPAMIPLEPVTWLKKPKGIARPRIAGVSSFGITGTDAHAIIEESPNGNQWNSAASNLTLDITDSNSRNWNMLKLSTKTEQALDILLEKFKETIAKLDADGEDEHMTMDDLCFTANTGRANFSCRAVVTGRSPKEFVSNINNRRFLKGECPSEDSSTKNICFLFTGQGSQYHGMARNLYETSPVFQMHFDYCCEILQKNYEIDIKKVLWSSNPDTSEVSRTIYSQTSIFCVEYALLKLWQSLGVTPDLVLGHSLGEFAAAVAAGILNVRDALKLVAERSILIDRLPTGKMLVIKADHSTVSSHISRFGKILDFAAINSGEQTVVAGDSSTILEFAQYLKTEQNLKCLVLEATHAFHSRHMDPMLDAYRQVALNLKKCPKKSNQTCVFVSGLRGRVIDSMEEVIDPQYWVDHTRQRVRFLEASKAVAVDCDIFIEIGPQPILSAMTMINNGDKSLTCLPSLKKNASSDWEVILGSLGKLYLEGLNIHWNGLDKYRSRKMRKVRLPLCHYPFIGKKFWPDLNTVSGVTIHPLIGCMIPNPTSLKLFQCGVNLRSHEFIKDHAIGDHCIFPGAGYLEMCLAAGMSSIGIDPSSKINGQGHPVKIEDLVIEAPLKILEEKTKQLHTVVDVNTEGDASVKIFQKNDDDATASSSSWLLHSQATFCPVPSAEDKKVEDFYSEEDFQKMRQGQDQVDDLFTTQVYEKLASLGLKFGPSFRSLGEIWKPVSELSFLAKVKFQPEAEGHQNKYIVHPVIIDAMIQAIMMLKMTSKSNLKKKLHVPIKIGRFVWLGKEMTCDLYIFAGGPTYASSSSTDMCTAVLVNSEGHPLAIMSKVEFIDTTVKVLESVLEHQTNSMPQMWEEVWRPQVGTIQHRLDLNLCNRKTTESDLYTDDLKESTEIQLFKKLEKYCYLNVLKALYECGWTPNLSDGVFTAEKLILDLKIDPGYRKLFKHYMHLLEAEGVIEGHGGDSWKVIRNPPSLEQVVTIITSPDLRDKLVQSWNVTLLYQEVGLRLSDILMGRQSPLEILFPPDDPGSGSNRKCPSVAELYDTIYPTFGMASGWGDALGSWLELCKSKNPDKFILRILEVGAGTGGSTRRVLEQLRKYDIEDFQYHFTDISSAFFTTVEKKFCQEKFPVKNMTFRKLNIEDDPVSQGFIPEYFDLIVASDMVHATKDIKRTLENMRSLLRSGGRLDIFEQTKVNRPITFIFGLLEGFWHFEDFDIRRDYCVLEYDMWLQTFKNCGFETVKSTRMLNGHHTYFSLRKCQRSGPTKVISVEGQSNNKLWLIFHLAGNKISDIITYLKDKIGDLANRKVILVHSGKQRSLAFDPNDNENESASTFSVRPDIEQDFGELMKIFGGKILEGIIYCWALDPEVTDQDDLLQPYFYLLKNMYKGGGNPRLITLTCDATNPGQDCPLGNIHSSTVLGVTKSFRNERTEFQGKCLDICVEGDAGVVSEETMLQVFYEIWKLDANTQVSFRSGFSYIPKLMALKPKHQYLSMPSGTDRFQLTLPETKSIQDLKFAPLEPFGQLGDLEVEVKIKASALNFKDVLNVIKPTDEFKSSNSVGFDYAGVIKSVGSKVTRWSVGDRVFGVNYNGAPLPSYTKQLQDNVIPVPDGVTFCEAATLPAVFSTAYHCLVDIAKITRNDTVLIHTASGGVGLLTIQICKNIGCSMICTAGSNRKRNFLRKIVGVENVFHSRNTEFQEKIMEVTKGRGVTVVLNSLTSDGFKEASLKCCSEGARFIEMSKLNIWTPQEVRDLRPDIFYRVVDLTTLEQPEATRLLQTLSKMLTEKAISPIHSVRFDAVRIREALQYLQKAKHIGKVMIIMPEFKQSKNKNEVMTPLFNKESTYLITGGLGGIGFTVCKWMVERQGARWVILAGRGSPGPKILQEIEELNKTNGSKVTCVKLDVSCYQECSDLLVSKIPELGAPPLRGIMHCAGTLHDGLIDNQDWPGFSSTFPTKIRGTLNLHKLTMSLDIRLEYFVFFSTFTANFGTPGQANHAAGNLFEDTFAHYRHSLGLPATTINWGQWGEVGIATEVEIPGVRPISNEQALNGLEYCLRSQRLQTSIINVESFVILNKLNRHVSNYLDEQIWKTMTSGKSLQSSSGIKSEEFWRLYNAISEKQNQSDGDDRSEKLEFVQGQLKHILREILKLEENEVIEDDANFQEMGVDSLMFVEMKNSLQTLFSDRVTVNASAVRDCDTVKKLTSQLVAMIEGDDFSSQDFVAPTTEEVAALIREDSQLPENIRAKEGSKAVDISDIKVVMVTGVTGTLGPYILKELTTGSVSDQVTKVICLIRPQRTLSSENRLRNVLQERNFLSEVDMSKVTVISGNIALPHLGLDDLQWHEVICEVDAVFHCAAMVQHVDYYRKARTDMRAVNIGGTKNILEFCCSGSKVKRLVHASTLFAVGTTDSKGNWSEDWPEIGDFDGVTTLSYSNTKFVADNLVKQAVQERGVPAKILRFPLIFGDSRSGRFVLENNHAMLRYLFIMKTGVMPSNPMPMILLPVDLCASIAVKIFFDQRFPDRIYNICHHRPPLDQEFVEVAKKLGYQVDIVEFSEFAKKVTESTQEDSPFAMFKEFYRDENIVMGVYTAAPALRHWMEMGNSEQSQNFFVSAKIKEILPEFYGDLEPAMEYVLRDLQFAQNSGWLKKFGL